MSGAKGWVLACLLFCELWALGSGVRCRECRYLPLDSGKRCFGDCAGDLCFLFHSAEGYLLQGCLGGSGLPRVELGCRRNAAGAHLCFCQEDRCNTQDGVLSRSIPFPLEERRCQAYVEFPGRRQRDSTACFSSVCGYERNLSPLAAQFPTRPVKRVGCLEEGRLAFDLDVFLSRGAGLLAAADRCYVTQLAQDRRILRCSCTKADLCNARGQLWPVEVPRPVRCLMAHNRRTDQPPDDLSEEPLCEGQYCLLQRIRAFPASNITFYNKGCYSGSHPRELSVGRRSGSAVEEWLCRGDLCNVDLASAQLSVETHRRRLFQHAEPPILLGDDPNVQGLSRNQLDDSLFASGLTSKPSHWFLLIGLALCWLWWS